MVNRPNQEAASYVSNIDGIQFGDYHYCNTDSTVA
jgi:hypothetical protein